MAMNKKWIWWAGSVALIAAGFLLRKKGVSMWRQARENAEMS